jgi:hypothetical protein
MYFQPLAPYGSNTDVTSLATQDLKFFIHVFNSVSIKNQPYNTQNISSKYEDFPPQNIKVTDAINTALR